MGRYSQQVLDPLIGLLRGCWLACSTHLTCQLLYPGLLKTNELGATRLHVQGSVAAGGAATGGNAVQWGEFSAWIHQGINVAVEGLNSSANKGAYQRP